MSNNVDTVSQTSLSDIKHFNISVISNNSLENNEDWKTYLCNCQTATCADAIAMCLKLGIRHFLDWSTIIDCLKMINILSGQVIVPHTKFKLFKLFADELKNFKYHIYCHKCKRYIGEFSTLLFEHECMCGTYLGISDKKSYFVMLDVKVQLKNLLNEPHISQHLQYRFNRQKNNGNSLEDVYDGVMYNEINQLRKESSMWNLSYMFNLDGCQAANSSKTTIWPIYATINELPPHLRNKHMLLIGIWADNCEPIMNIFLRPFVKIANELSDIGFTWRLPNNEIVVTRLFPTCCCVDSVARAAILNMKQFNGKYGCTFCEHPTERVNNQRKYTMLNVTPPNRTDVSIKTNMIEAYKINTNQRKQHDYKGVWGPSPLMNLKYFDIAKGMVPEYMHSVLLGVTKQYTEIIMSSENSNKKFYVGSPAHIAIIDNILIKIKIPKSITRYPRSIKERKLWKASEWRNWLIWYSIICLRFLLPAKYLKHLTLLSTAIHICLQKSVTLEMVDYAETLLIKFVKLFQKYFGKENMTYNVHLLLHICSGIRNWGPLWTHNAFSYENENRILLRLKKSPKDVAIQISRRFLFQKLYSHVSLYVSEDVNKFCNLTLDTNVKYFSYTNKCMLLGRGEEYILTREEENCLDYTVNYCERYKKIIYKNTRYTSKTYTRKSKINDSIVMLTDGSIGQIQSICKVYSNNCVRIIIFLRKFRIYDEPFITTKYVNVTYIKTCNLKETFLIACNPENLTPCILMQIEHYCYVSAIPYGCLKD